MIKYSFEEIADVLGKKRKVGFVDVEYNESNNC